MRRAKMLLFSYLFAIAALVVIAFVGLAFSPGVPRDPEMYYEVYQSTIQTFDPARAYDTVSNLMLEQVYEGLYEYDGDKWDYTIIPALAADMPEISDDGLTYTIRIRPNVRYPAKWADGSWIEPWRDTPRHVRAEDFVLAFKRLADFHTATDHFGSVLQGKVVGANEFREQMRTRRETEWCYDDFELEGVRALDEFTLEIRLLRSFPQLIYKLMGPPTAPMPREYLYHYTVEEPTKRARARGEIGPDEVVHRRSEIKWRMMGTGPYQLVDYQRERHVKFEHNPMYRGRPNVDGHPNGLGGTHPDLPADRVLPYSIKRQHYIYSREELPRWYNFTLGEYDKLLSVPKDMFGLAVAEGNISPELAERGVRQHRNVRFMVEYVAFHLRAEDELFRDNLPLRRAMSLAIDRRRYIELFRNGDAMEPNGLVPPGSFTYDPDYRNPWYRFDPEEAARQVEEARRIHRERTGNDLPVIRYNLRGAAATHRQQGEFLRLAWEKVGLRVEPVHSDFARWLDDLRSRSFQHAYSGGWVGDYPDEETFFTLFYSPNYEDGPNGSGYSNPEYDALYERSKQVYNTPERDELYLKMARIIEEDLPIAVIYYDIRRMLYYDWLGEVRDHIYLRAQPAYYRLDGALREARLDGGLRGTLEELHEQGLWPPASDQSVDPSRTREAAREDAER